MSSLIGAVTLGSAVSAMLLGQVAAGAPLAGVILASLVLMTVRA